MKRSVLFLLLIIFFAGLASADVIWHGQAASPEVFLTFDDGPNFSETPKVLALLKKLEVKALFFLIGNEVAVNPSLAREITAEGHEIGNHTYSHSHDYRITKEFAEEEIERTSDVIFKAAGVKPKYYRPPYGYFNPQYFQAMRQRGMTAVFWSVDSSGYQVGHVQEFVDNLCQNIDNGSIIMFHQSDILKPGFADAVSGIVKKLRQKGFSFQLL